MQHYFLNGKYNSEQALIPKQKGVIDMKNLLVYRTRIAKELMDKGYELIDLMPNNRHPKQTVFVFKGVDGLYEDYQEIKVRTWEN